MTFGLVVDDAGVVRKFCRRILEELNFEVKEAENGQVALDITKESLPDVILLDWNMPVMNGLEFLKAFRAEVDTESKTIVIFCTTENEFPRIQQGIAAGANEYVMKPFDKAIIETKLQQLGVISPTTPSEPS